MKDQLEFMDVMSSVVAERLRAIEKYGTGLRRPDGTNPKLIPLLEQVRDLCSAKTDVKEETWTEVLAEEFLEVITEPDAEKLEAELIQLAGVASGWAWAIRKRRKKRK